MLMAIIGDLETCIGFLLAGIGQNLNGKQNYFIVEKDTVDEQIDRFVMDTMHHRPDIAILLVASDVAQRIKHTIKRFQRNMSPVMLIIPTKLQPYDMTNDPVIASARVRPLRFVVNVFIRIIIFQSSSKSPATMNTNINSVTQLNFKCSNLLFRRSTQSKHNIQHINIVSIDMCSITIMNT